LKIGSRSEVAAKLTPEEDIAAAVAALPQTNVRRFMAARVPRRQTDCPHRHKETRMAHGQPPDVFYFALKGHGFSRAAIAPNIMRL